MNTIYNNQLAKKIKRAIKKAGVESGYNYTLNLKADAADIVARYKLDIKKGLPSYVDGFMCWDVEHNDNTICDSYGVGYERSLYDTLTIRDLQEMEEEVKEGINSYLLEMFDGEGGANSPENWNWKNREDLIIIWYINEMLCSYIDDKYSVSDLDDLIE